MWRARAEAPAPAACRPSTGRSARRSDWRADDRGDQLVAAADVPVDRGRADVELGGQPAHGQRRRALADDEVERGGDDLVAVEPGVRSVPSCPCAVALPHDVCNSVIETYDTVSCESKGEPCRTRWRASTRATRRTSSSRPTRTPGCRSRTTAPYLESSVHAEFDEWLVTRHQHRTMVEEVNGEYVERVGARQRGGPPGRLRPRRPRQGARRRRRRRRGDLPRRRLGHRHGGAAVRRRAAGRA